MYTSEIVGRLVDMDANKTETTETLMTIQYASAYGVTIQRARRGGGHRELVSLGGCEELPGLGLVDIRGHLGRPSDGEFRGCDNYAWLLSQSEADYFRQLSADRQETKKAAQALLEDAEQRRQIKPPCRRCGSHCYGDCTASQ